MIQKILTVYRITHIQCIHNIFVLDGASVHRGVEPEGK